MQRFVLTVVLVLLALPDDAEACSCCDGASSSVVLGWSESGKSALVEHKAYSACERYDVLQIWVVGASEPAGCFDRFHDPEKRIPCDLVDFAESHEQKPRASTRLRHFPQAVAELPKERFKVARRRSGAVTVTVERDGAWRRVLRTSVPEGRRATVRIFPAPTGDGALLVLSDGEYEQVFGIKLP